MKCPHCLENFYEHWEYDYLSEDIESHWHVRYCACPSCEKLIIELGNKNSQGEWDNGQLVKPKGISRSPLSTDIPSQFAEDYKEACLVLHDSPKASAALSRRCLQNLLRDKAMTKTKDLVDQIQEILDSKSLPSYLANSLDAVRVIGNFAAHPIKSKGTGEIVEVEPGEAEWNLDTIEGLFDFYFIQEKIIFQKKEILNKKLTDAGKPPIK